MHDENQERKVCIGGLQLKSGLKSMKEFVMAEFTRKCISRPCISAHSYTLFSSGMNVHPINVNIVVKDGLQLENTLTSIIGPVHW